MTDRHEDALERLDTLPRTLLAHTPTPLLEARNLARTFAPPGLKLYLKMDAWTGTGLGGNKVRKLEYVVTPERLGGTDTVITSGGVQSNHARVTAAVAARFGLRCILVLDGDPGNPPRGNALLHRLLGAEIRIVPEREEREDEVAAVSNEIEEEGGRPLVVPLGASNGEGALGYVRAARELDLQLGARSRWSEGPVWFVLPASSAGTVAGLALGLRLVGRSGARIVAVSADEPEETIVETARGIGADAAKILEVEGSPAPDRIQATDAQVGPGYGIPTEASREATRLFGELEGVVLDPTYTAKAGAELLAGLSGGSFGEEGSVVFLHTGGHPALFA